MSQKPANGNFKSGKGRGGGPGGGGGPPSNTGGKPFQQPRPQTSGPSFQPVSSQPSPPKPLHQNQPQPQPQGPQQPPLPGQVHPQQPIQQRQTPQAAQQTPPIHNTQPQTKQKPPGAQPAPQVSQPLVPGQMPPAQGVPPQPSMAQIVQGKGPQSQGMPPQQFQPQPQPNRKAQTLPPTVQNGGQGRQQQQPQPPQQQQQQGRLPSGQGPLQGPPLQQNPSPGPGVSQPSDSKTDSIKGGEGTNQPSTQKAPRGPGMGETPVAVVPKANAQVQSRQGAPGSSAQGFPTFQPSFTPVTNPASGLPYPITYPGNLNQPNYPYHTQPNPTAAPQPTQPAASNRPSQIPKRFAPAGFSNFQDPSEKSEETDAQVSPSAPFVPPQRPLSAPPTPNYRDQQRNFYPYKTTPPDPAQYPYYPYYNNPVLPPTSPNQPIHQVHPSHPQFPNQHPTNQQSHAPYNYVQPQYGPGSAHHVPQNMHPTLPSHLPTSPNHSPHTTPTTSTSAANPNQPNYMPTHSSVRTQIPVSGGPYVHSHGLQQMMPPNFTPSYTYQSGYYPTQIPPFQMQQTASKRLPIIDPSTQKEISVSPPKDSASSSSSKPTAAVSKASPNLTKDVGFNLPSQEEKTKGSAVEPEKKTGDQNQEKASTAETKKAEPKPTETSPSETSGTKTSEATENKEASKESKPAERAQESGVPAPATKEGDQAETKSASKEPDSRSEAGVSPKSSDGSDDQLSPSSKGSEADAGQAPKKLSKKQKKQEKRLKEQQQKEQQQKEQQKENQEKEPLAVEVKEEPKKQLAQEPSPAEQKKDEHSNEIKVPNQDVPESVQTQAPAQLTKETADSSKSTNGTVENGTPQEKATPPESVTPPAVSAVSVEDKKDATPKQSQENQVSPKKEEKEKPTRTKDKDANQSHTEEDDDWERKEEADLVISTQENAPSKSSPVTPQPIVYPDGVWTPDNPAGKKMYNKDFLLKFQPLCTVKPDGLPPMEVILGADDKQDKALSGPNPNWRNPNAALMPNAGRGLRNAPDLGLPLPNNFPMGRGGQMMPGYPLMNVPPQFNQGGRNAILGRGGRGGFPKGMKPKQPPIPTGPPVSPLVPTKDRWVRPNNSAENERNIVILRKTQGLLNRLAPDNFDNIFNKILALGIDTVELLKGLIGQLFDKAVSEPAYSPMYAELCKKLAEKAPEFKDEANSSKTQTFKRILLNKCQEEFEKKLPRPSENLSDQEKEEYEFKVRKRMIGNIRFIGELYKIKMLTERIMYECIERLIGDPQGIPPPEDIEAFCQLFTTIGVMIDRPNTKMNLYFTAMDKLRKKPELPNRLRFMIDNVIDLRSNNWIPRKVAESPKETDAKEPSKPSFDPRGNVPMAPKKPAATIPMPVKPAPPPQPAVSKDGWEQVPTRRDKKGEPVLGPGGKFTSGGAKGWGAQRDAPSDNKSDLMKGSRFSTLQTDSPKSNSDRSQRDRGDQRGDRGDKSDRTDRAAERSEKREQEKAPKAAALSFEQFDAKAEEILEEFFSSNELKEAVECVKELHSPNFHHEFIGKGILIAMEKKEADRSAIGNLLHEFRASGTMTEEDIIKGYQTSLKDIEDIIIDVPTLPINIGTLLGTSVAKNDVSLSRVPEILNDLVNTGRAESVIPTLFDALFDQGLDAKKMYEEAKLDIQSFLKPSNRNADYLSKYLTKHDLGVLTGAAAARTKVGKKVFEKQTPAIAPSSDEENEADSE